MIETMLKSARSTGLVLACLFSGRVASGEALDTKFTYQGRLSESAVPYNGSLNMQFKLFNAATGGSALACYPSACSSWVSDVPVTDGLYSIQLDFGAGPSQGEKRWVEVWIQKTNPPDPPGAAVSLGRFEVKASPVALYALKSESAGGFQGSTLSNGDGISAVTLAPGAEAAPGVTVAGSLSVGSGGAGKSLTVHGPVKTNTIQSITGIPLFSSNQNGEITVSSATTISGNLEATNGISVIGDLTSLGSASILGKNAVFGSGSPGVRAVSIIGGAGDSGAFGGEGLVVDGGVGGSGAYQGQDGGAGGANYLRGGQGGDAGLPDEVPGIGGRGGDIAITAGDGGSGGASTRNDGGDGGDGGDVILSGGNGGQGGPGDQGQAPGNAGARGRVLIKGNSTLGEASTDEILFKGKAKLGFLASFQSVTQTVAANQTVSPVRSALGLTSAVPVTLSTTTAVADPSSDQQGAVLLLVNTGSSTISINDGANVELSTSSIALGPADSLSLVFQGAKWYEVGRSTWSTPSVVRTDAPSTTVGPITVTADQTLTLGPTAATWDAAMYSQISVEDDSTKGFGVKLLGANQPGNTRYPIHLPPGTVIDRVTVKAEGSPGSYINVYIREHVHPRANLTSWTQGSTYFGQVAWSSTGNVCTDLTAGAGITVDEEMGTFLELVMYNYGSSTRTIVREVTLRLSTRVY